MHQQHKASGTHELPATIGKPATRALNALGICSLEQLVSYSEQELAVLHGVGPKAIRLLKQELAGFGWSLKPAE
jgi:predicted flap endonuclease-1-like 5' DNA nuclease